MFKRPLFQHLLDRLNEPRRFIQVLAGPRQVGKTTLAQQIVEVLPVPSHYASADAPALQNGSRRSWAYGSDQASGVEIWRRHSPR